MSKKIIILGGLGNGSVIANAIEDANNRGYNEYEFSGYLNDRLEVGETIEKYPVLGKLSDIPKFLGEGYYFINTILRIDGQEERIKMINDLNIPSDRWAVFIHPTAYVAPNVEFGPGCVVMPQVCISSGTKFGHSCILMVASTIGHDNLIGDFCHVAAQACVGAYLKIDSGVHIGLNCTIRENISIGKNATIGMGSVLLKDVGENEIWAGVPAKYLRKAE